MGWVTTGSIAIMRVVGVGVGVGGDASKTLRYPPQDPNLT